MSVTWLERREPTHYLCILLGLIDDGVETIVYVAAVNTAITELDRESICNLGHDVRAKMSRVCIIETVEKGVALMGSFQKSSFAKGREKQGYLAPFMALPNHFLYQGDTNVSEVLVDYH